MKHVLHINQTLLKSLGIRNINQAHILDLLTSVHSWAEEIIHDGKVYYWVARSVICEELWILNIKEDTAYRHLKKLAELGLIEYIKIGQKDCIRLTTKGKKYSTNRYVGNESEKEPNRYVGFKSELGQNSDLNPTYPNTTIYHKKNKQKKIFTFALPKKQSYDNLSKEYKQKLKAKCLLIDGNLSRYEDFITALEAKGYKYKDFSKAYMSWDREKSYKSYKPTPEPQLGADWFKITHGKNIIAVNRQTLEIKTATLGVSR